MGSLKMLGGKGRQLLRGCNFRKKWGHREEFCSAKFLEQKNAVRVFNDREKSNEERKNLQSI